MTGGQPSPTSPVNLAGDNNTFNLEATLKAHGAKVITVSAYSRKEIKKVLPEALALGEKGEFVTLIVEGTCIRKMPQLAWGIKMSVNADICKRCGLCQICPGIQADKEGLPFHNNFCSGCVGQGSACAQMCPVGAIAPEEERKKEISAKQLPAAPEEVVLPALPKNLPEKLAVAIRGVGGQGNLFFGRVLTQLAFLAGYGDTNVVKGETHGMAQMGGPVISTFSCGKVSSPTLLPGTVDCLVSMELSEVLRDGFIKMLKPGGTILLTATRIYPYGLAEENYPAEADILAPLKGYNVMQLDVLAEAINLGDAGGRSANVVMIGALSTLSPFCDFPAEYWLQALKNVSPKPALWDANYAAFSAGRKMME